MEETFAHANWEQMGRHAHQLKGAGGGYGFPGLTEVAVALESCCKADLVDETELKAALDHVIDYLNRVRI